jgi:DNA-binding transcriptional ArsR family regulator
MTAPDTEILIEDLEGFRVIDNPLRQRILHLARHPKSVREMADGLGVPVTRLYYHVNMLEKAGFLDAIDVRKSGAQLERIYQSRRGAVRPSPDFVENVGDMKKAAHVLAGALLDITRVEVEAVIERGLRDEEGFGDLARVVLQLPTPVAQDFSRRIEELVREMRDAATANDDKDATIYSLTYAFIPTDTP